MSDGFQQFPYKEYTTRRNSTASKRTSTEPQPLSPASAAGPMIPSPIASLVPTPVPSVVYFPYNTPPGSPAPAAPAPGTPAPGTTAPGSPRADSPAPDSIVIEPIEPPASIHGSRAPRSVHSRSHAPTTSSSSSSSSSSSARALSAAHQSRAPQSRTHPRRRRRHTTIYDPNDFHRIASMNQAKETGRPQRYGVTRDARIAHMQENGRVRVGKGRVEGGCGCVIL